MRIAVRLFCIILLLSPFLYKCGLENEFELLSFKNKLHQLPHPEKTELVTELIYLRPPLTGDHCDYRFFQIRKRDDFSLKEIEYFYSNNPIEFNERYSKDVAVYSIEEYKTPPWEEQEKSAINLIKQDLSQYYIITLTIAGKDEVPPLVDIRCI